MIKDRQIARINGFKQTQRPAFEKHLQHLIFPPSPRMLHRVRLVALLAHIRSRNNFAPRIDLIGLNCIIEFVAHNIEAESTLGIGELGNQGSHSTDCIRAQLLIGYQSL